MARVEVGIYYRDSHIVYGLRIDIIILNQNEIKTATMVMVVAAMCSIASWGPESEIWFFLTTHWTSGDLIKVKMGSLKLLNVQFIGQKYCV